MNNPHSDLTRKQRIALKLFNIYTSAAKRHIASAKRCKAKGYENLYSNHAEMALHYFRRAASLA